jgi:arylformamidase
MPRHALVDLSHVVEDGRGAYPGLPQPRVRDVVTREASRERYAAGTEFHIGALDLVANTGTYIDAPFHRFPAGRDVAGFTLAQVADVPGVVVRVPRGHARALGVDLFRSAEVAGRAVLVHTGWDAHWGTPRYATDHPYLTEGAGDFLVEAGAALVGIDSLNIDDTADGRRPVHTRLLGADVPIVEHLCHLERLPAAGFHFFAVPVKVRGLGSFPVRAFARVPAP